MKQSSDIKEYNTIFPYSGPPNAWDSTEITWNTIRISFIRRGSRDRVCRFCIEFAGGRMRVSSSFLFECTHSVFSSRRRRASGREFGLVARAGRTRREQRLLLANRTVTRVTTFAVTTSTAIFCCLDPRVPLRSCFYFFFCVMTFTVMADLPN